MAKLIKLASGEWYIEAAGGERNREIIPSTRVKVQPPVKKVDEFKLYEDSQYGWGKYVIKIYKDATGKEIAVISFDWMPAPGYSWDESWEEVTDNPKVIEDYKRKKVVEKQNLP